MNFKNFLFRPAIISSILSLTLSLTTSCTDLDPVNQRIDNVESEIESLKSEFAQLKEAWENYKIISDLQSIPGSDENSDNGGWLLKFTDGTSMRISNGDDGLTPFIKIDSEGYWIVSYDGETYEYITDQNGEKISAIGIDGKDGKYGEDGKDGEDGKNGQDGQDGKDGKDGKDGRCVRVVIDNKGYYCYEIYDPASPDLVIETISTPYTSDPSSTIAAIVRDEKTGTVTFTMGDGSIYTFEMQKTVPSGIVILTTDKIIFKKPGETKSFDIRVNPSNIFFNYNVSSGECDLTLEYINRETSFNGSQTFPVKIEEITPTKDKKGNKIEGQYTVTIKDSGANLTPYSEGVFLTLKYTDPNKEEVYITSDIFIVEYSNAEGLLLETGLPIVMINTPKEIDSKQIWVEDCTIRIIKDGKCSDVYSNVQMKGRGNSTWSYPKKPYAIKLDTKEEVLGMNKHKRWVLLANYVDRTLMRNAVAFRIAEQTGLDYTPSGEFVELIMNGNYKGNYYLAEQIKVDKNRVNIAELDPEAVSGEALTGGYLMELDINYDEAYKFKSTVFDYPWMFKDPDVVNTSQFYFMYNYVAAMEEEINKIPRSARYENYLDINSSIDFWFVNELMTNYEITWTKSIYMAKDINSKFKMGPVWDFDWGTLKSLYPQNLVINKSLYYEKLFQDPKFVETLKHRWNMFYGKFQTIPDFIDETARKIYVSQQLNYNLWGVPAEPNNESKDFDEAVKKIKDAYIAKLELMNTLIASL